MPGMSRSNNDAPEIHQARSDRRQHAPKKCTLGPAKCARIGTTERHVPRIGDGRSSDGYGASGRLETGHTALDGLRPGRAIQQALAHRLWHSAAVGPGVMA